MSRLALYLLGPPRIELDDKPVQISRRKVVALLAYLAVTGTPHSRDALATLLWPERSQSRARAYLRRALSELNRTLGEGFLTIDRETAGLHPSAALSLDVDIFRQLLAAGDAHDHPATEVCSDCVASLEEAVELYRDDFMAGFTLRDSPDFDEWQFFQCENLRDALASALERLMRWHSSQREYDPAIAYARRWLALDPLHEPVHRHLMELYAQAGRRAAVERQYQECVQVLEAELGAPPADATTALYQQLQTRPKESDERLFPAAPPRHNLPVQTTPFVGRESELEEIAVLLQDPDCRLLTLVGPGGSGKTRLAVEAAAAQLDTNGYAYADGIFFVSLAPVQDADAIVPSVADALGFRFYSGGTPQEQLLSYLRRKHLLLIMDNYEHLLDGVGLVTEIIKTAPDVKILATSRARLNVVGEHRFHVGGMDYPEYTEEVVAAAQDYGAVKLFLQGARRAQSGFQLTEDNLSGILQVCSLVEGMPLGIGLAAAWVQILAPPEIASEIRRSLDFLETEMRGVPERQRSMRAVFDHSWTMLTEREREVMRALSVFRGGFTRQAAQQVSGASLAELMALVNKSLVHSAPEGYFEVHELLRQYAAEKLGEMPSDREAVHDRHCAYYAAAAERWGSELKGPQQVVVLAEMRADRENVHVACEWAVAHRQVARLSQALDGLCWHFLWRGRFRAGQAACQAAADVLGPKPQGDRLFLMTRILAWESGFCTKLGQPHTASETLTRCLSLLDTLGPDSLPVKAGVLRQMGGLAFRSGDNVKARRLFEESLDLCQTLGDRWGEAEALTNIGRVAWSSGAYDEAQRWAEKSLEIRQSRGDKRGIANSLDLLGFIAAYQGQMDESVKLRRELLAIYNQIGDRPGAADGLFALATGVIWSGEFAEAKSLLEDSREIYDDLGSRVGVALDDLFLGWIDGVLGRYAQARARIENSLLDFRETGHRRRIGLALLWLGILTLADEDYAAAEALLKEAAECYEEIGQRDEWSTAVAGLGYVARALGDTAQARSYLCEALKTGVELHSFALVIMSIPTVALLLADAGDSGKELAVEIYALASRYRYISKSRFYEDIVGRHIAAVAATLPPDVVAAAQERGRARDLWETAEELLDELNA